MITALIGLAAASHPSLWTDEVATANAVSRSWSQLFDLLGRVDAVHGLYYSLVKPLVDILGVNATTLRLPSALAAGLAAALTVRLTWALAGRDVALVAGALAATLPALATGAVEARSPVFVAASATATTCALVLASRRGRFWWIGYGVALVPTAALSLVALSIVAVHAVTLAWSASSRRTWLCWGGHRECRVSCHLSIGDLGLPPERAGRLGPPSDADAVRGHVRGRGMVRRIARGRRLGLVRDPLRLASSGRRMNDLVAVAVPWLIVPGLCLAVATVLVTPVYVPRYLAFCAPAAVMLAALGLGQLHRTPRFLLLSAIILSCAGVVVQQRGAYGTQDSDWRTAAEQIDELASPGDPIVFVPDRGEPRSPRRAPEAYPQRFEDVRDIGASTTPAESGGLWGTGRGLAASAPTLRRSERSWGLVSAISVDGSVAKAQALFRAEGLDADLVWPGPATLIFEVTPLDGPEPVSRDSAPHS